MTRHVRGLLTVGIAVVAATATLTAGPAMAQAAPAVYAFGAEVTLGGEPVVPPTPEAAVDAPPGDAAETVIDIPAAPVAVSGTLTAIAGAHNTADIDTGLTVVEQELAGPYHAQALAEVEDLGVVYEVAGAGVPLVSAAVVRAEAVAVCTPTPTFAATSEIIDLAVGGEPVPLNAPVQDLIDAISDVLEQSGLNAVVDVQRNVVTQLPGGGVSVDALVVTLLAAAGETPLGVVRIAHAEVHPSACPAPPECSDTADNDGDGMIDSADPGCHSDGDAANAATYEPLDDDERNSAALAETLPATGASPTAALIGTAALLTAIAAWFVRRAHSGFSLR